MAVDPPTKIHSPEPYLIAFEWRDGFSAIVKLEDFRAACPCASCTGEKIMGQMVVPPALQMFTPGMYTLTAINPVGAYAIQASWQDGHNTGIYSWDILRSIAEKFTLAADEVRKLKERAAAEQAKTTEKQQPDQ